MAGPWRRAARWLVIIALPTVVLLVDGFPLLLQAESRYDDGLRGIRLVNGNGVKLDWAPAGPGWFRAGDAPRSWNELARYGRYEARAADKVWTEGMTDATAADMAAAGLPRFLSPDGRRLQADPANVWRLPTVAELVASLTRGGHSALGRWHPERQEAEYARQPDKESPLWDLHSPAIYYWSSTEVDAGHAWVVTYNGQVLAFEKNRRSPSIGYRCVRRP
jgi:hypothetical protein